MVEQLKKGSILSETSFFVVKGVNGNVIQVTDDLGNDSNISKEYVENILNSADVYTKTEDKTMTQLAEIFLSNSRVAMTVAFYKKDTAKTKKAYEAEKAAKINEIQNAKVSDVPNLLANLIENPISKVITGELRVMKGRHYGSMDDLGRIHFVDMEVPKGAADAAHDPRSRQVDPRTIQYIIVSGVRYNLKK